jgi:hypothetical protein
MERWIIYFCVGHLVWIEIQMMLNEGRPLVEYLYVTKIRLNTVINGSEINLMPPKNRLAWI